MLKLGNKEITNIMLGSTQVVGAYLGNNLVWSKSSILPYLDFNVNRETSHKSRYFDTGVIPTENTSIEYCFGINNEYLTEIKGFQCGVRTAWIRNAFSVNFSQSGWNGIWYMWNTKDYKENAGVSWQRTDQYVIFKQGAGGKVYVNGTLVKDLNENLSPPNYTIFIGDINENGIARGKNDGQGIGRVFWVKIYENETMTHHYTPEIYNEHAGLYDEVSNIHLQSITDTDMPADTIQYGTIPVSNI